MKYEKSKTNVISIVLMIVCALCLCLGQFIWKLYGNALALACGFIIYGIGALSMLCAYRLGRVSILQPINSVSYIISAIIGAMFFNEIITWQRIIGIALVLIGVVILTREETTT